MSFRRGTSSVPCLVPLPRTAMTPPTPLRRELLFAFGILFGGGILIASVGLAIILPLLDSPREAGFYVLTLLLAESVVIFFFGRLTLGNSLLRPMDNLVEDVQTIASGAFEHRIRSVPTEELQVVADSVNALAGRLIQDQRALAENIRSLDETNRALVEARAQVVRAARLASAGTLASGIAHELGNPLGALIAYVDVARSRAQSRGEDHDLLDSIREEALRIDRIIRSLLDFTRARDAELGPQDAWTVVKRVRELLEAQGRLDGVECVWDCQGGVSPVVIDAQRLEQVLVNVLLNALDAVSSSDEPLISVSLKEVPGPASMLPPRRKGDPPGVNYAHRRRIAGGKSGSVSPLVASTRVVVLTVEDNGTGIDADMVEQIFDPFFTTKEPGKGTGLGLALSAQLVEGMGGEILAGNREAGGAVFTIRLPADGASPVGTVAEPGTTDTESNKGEDA